MWHYQYPPQGGCPPRICPPPHQYRDPGHLPPQQQYTVPQDYLPQIHPPPQQYGAPSYPPQQQYSSPQGGYPPQGFPLPQQYGAPGYPPPRQQYGAPQGYPPQQQQFSPLPGQYQPQQHSYGAPPPGQYGNSSLGPPPGQYGAPPLGQYVALPLQHYGGGPSASHIRKVESLATSRVDSEDAMSTHDSSPPSETTDPCYWCSRIILRDESSKLWPDQREWLQELFHSDCECRRRENAVPSSACGFCKHLNLRHLFRCAYLRHQSSFPTIFSGWYCQTNPQNGCQLCEYIASYGTWLSQIGLDFGFYVNAPEYFFILKTIDEDNKIHLRQHPVLQLQEHVNWEQIREWTFEFYPEEGNLPADFRVIDVERNCIVTPDYPVNYIALSYVWGDSAQKEKPFQASMRNIKDLEIEGSLSRASLPHTITDAMEVCRQLNRKYLWVDRLCIIQDHESKHGQIQRMDSIFKSSEFTIVALSGRDANDGLAGVSKPRESHRLKILEWQAITLTDEFPSIEDLVESSYWGERGWTFQEELCSRNNLYFTEYGVYQCRRGSTQNTECPAEDDEKGTYFYFPCSVEAYAARSFTDPGDLVRAFTGVLNIEYGGRHHFGNAAPENNGVHANSFSEWIHWQPVDWEYEARRPPKDVSMKPVSHIQPHKSDIFPSWSWTSAQGGVKFYDEADPVALWAIPVDQESQEDSNVEWVSDGYDAYELRKITVEGGLMSAEEFPVQLENERSRVISASSTLFQKADRDEACKKLGRVLSFAQIASLRLECFDNHFCDGRRTFRIISSSGRCIGGIFLPKLSLEYIFNRDGGLRDKEFKLIALSTDVWGWCEDAKRTLKGVGLKRRKGREILSVMLIWQAKDSNVSRRLGIGHVFQDKWLKERPVLKTIILE